ncbi:MAG: hypothetical protein FJ087_16245 [Deltaproteobacteria bacterium]|nr:hypothetical protein [Deltaproteobacteria bacterium]
MKVAIATDDGVKVSQRFGRVAAFLVAEIGAGTIAAQESRRNPAGARIPARREPHRDRHRAVSELLSDCRVVIASTIGDSMRRALNRRGLEVIITSEELVDRALALFALAALRDESRVGEDDDGYPDAADPAEAPEEKSAQDEFDA